MEENREEHRKHSGLVDADVEPTTGKTRKDNYEYLHTEERKAEEQRRLMEARAKVEGGKIRKVRCLICANERQGEEANYVAQTIITHLYSVHGLKKAGYQAYCLEKGYVDSPEEAPVRTPDLQPIFKAAGATGATKLFEKIDQGKTHLYVGDSAEDKAGDQVKRRKEAEAARRELGAQGVVTTSTPEEEAEAEEAGEEDVRI